METTASTLMPSLEAIASSVDTVQMWILIVGFVVAFFLAFGVGANDVANSFGTSVGAKVLTLRQACILATIFETLGAVLIGYKVSDTVRKGIFDVSIYADDEKTLMLGCLSALLGSAVWNILATFLALPISGTHSIVGAMAGFTMVARGPSFINWKGLIKIVSSWFVSPVLSGLLSTAIFLIILKFILKSKNPVRNGLISLPFFYFGTLLVNLLSIFLDGPVVLKFDLIPVWAAIIISTLLALAAAITVWFYLVPRLKSKIDDKKVPTKGMFSKELVTIDTRECHINVAFENTEDSTTAVSTKTIAVSDANTNNAGPPNEVNQLFSFLQVLTAIFGSFAHGGNDVSNAIGPLVSLWLIYNEGSVQQKTETPIWILLYGGFGICIGLWIYGQKVIKTVGEGLTKISPTNGFSIEVGAATTVLLASKIGLPISTTHCKVGSVVLVGMFSGEEKNGVNWSLFKGIIAAWVFTLPITGGLSALFMVILQQIV